MNNYEDQDNYDSRQESNWSGGNQRRSGPNIQRKEDDDFIRGPNHQVIFRIMDRKVHYVARHGLNKIS